jgi:rhodanese-related sulfurtransferase
MLTSWFSTPQYKIGFEDVNYAIRHPSTHLIINTLSADNQDCLIKNTMAMEIEERTMNEMLQQYTFKDKRIIVYGKHAADPTVETKYKQLKTLGFPHVYVYVGGLFEWILLQDIYGTDEFPTTKRVVDILRYKPGGIFSQILR